MIKNEKEQEIDSILSGFCENLPANLRLLRLREGLTQEKFGELLRMSRTSYNRLERGRLWPDLVTVCLILFTFDLPLGFLLSKDLEDCVYYADCTRHCCDRCDCTKHQDHAGGKG